MDNKKLKIGWDIAVIVILLILFLTTNYFWWIGSRWISRLFSLIFIIALFLLPFLFDKLEKFIEKKKKGKKLIGLFDTEGKTKEEFANEVIDLLKKHDVIEEDEYQPTEEELNDPDLQASNARWRDPNSAVSKAFDNWWAVAHGEKEYDPDDFEYSD